jgi:hypothetical protein
MCEHHAPSLASRPENVQSFFIPSFACRTPPYPDESAVTARFIPGAADQPWPSANRKLIMGERHSTAPDVEIVIS